MVRSETDVLMPIYRVQLFEPSDIDNVKKVQSGFKVQTLSSFLGTPAPQAAPAIDFIKPLTVETQKTSLEFFNILNFRTPLLPDRLIRSGTDETLRQDRRGCGPVVRRKQAFA